MMAASPEPLAALAAERGRRARVGARAAWKETLTAPTPIILEDEHRRLRLAWAAASASLQLFLGLPRETFDLISASAPSALPLHAALSSTLPVEDEDEILWAAFLDAAVRHCAALAGGVPAGLAPPSPSPPPRAPLPPPLRAIDGGFTLDSLVRRLPAILEETLAVNAPSGVGGGGGYDHGRLCAAVRSELCVPLVRGDLLSPPPAAPLDGEPAERGMDARWWTPLDEEDRVSWFYQEVLSYRHLLRHWISLGPRPERGGGALLDPFARQKASAIAAARGPFLASLSLPAPLGGELGLGHSLQSLMLAMLWGNRMDLSLSSGRVVAADKDAVAAIGGSAGGPDPFLLADDSRSAIERFILADGSLSAASSSSPVPAPAAASPPPTKRHLTIVLDNCGQELLCDLRFVDALLQAGLGWAVTLQCKAWPVFVSDALPNDVVEHIDWMSAGGGGAGVAPEDGDGGAAACASLGRRLRESLSSGALRVDSHRFWNSTHAAWRMPASLRDDLAASALIIFKGDANYRRLVGDRHWPHATPFQDVVGTYAPAPILSIRTCKAGVLLGVSEEAERRAAAVNPKDWLTSGQFGVIQLALPMTT